MIVMSTLPSPFKRLLRHILFKSARALFVSAAQTLSCCFNSTLPNVSGAGYHLAILLSYIFVLFSCLLIYCYYCFVFLGVQRKSNIWC